MSLGDPYGGGIWGQFEQAQENAPLLAGKLQSQGLLNDAQKKKNALAEATMPSEISEAQSKATMAANGAALSSAVTPLEIAKQKQQAAALATQMNGEALATAAKTLDPSSPTFGDDFNKVIDDQIAQGNPLAKQFRGHPSMHALDTLMNAYGGGPNANPLASYAAQKSGSMPTPNPDKVEQTRAALAATPPAMWPAVQAKMEKMKADIMAVDNADDPKAALNAVAQDFGVAGLGDHFNRPMWESLKATLAPQLAAYDEVVAQRASGAPAPPPAQKLEKVGSDLVAVAMDPRTGKMTATTIAEADKWAGMLGAQGPNGGPMIFDTKTGAFREGPGTAKESAIQTKIRILSAGPNGLKGQALIDAANGNANITDRQIATSAAAHVTSQINARTLSDPTYKPPGEAEKAQMIAAEAAAERAALAAPAAGPPAAGGTAPTDTAMPPPAALARLKEGVPHAFANGQVWTLKGGQPVRVK